MEIQNPDPTPVQNPPNSPFTQKKVDRPLFDQNLRNRLSPGGVSVARGSVKEFYLNNKFYFWGIFLGVIVISLLSYFALRRTPVAQLSEARVNIVIAAPPTVPSGTDVVYKITVENQDKQKLVSAQLEVAYPEGFSFVSSSPQPDNLSGTLFSIPDLIPGQNVTVFVKAKASGNLNDSKELDAALHYKYSNSSLEFIKKQVFSVRLSASNVAMDLSGPQTTNNAQLVIFKLVYKNNSDNDINNAHVTFTYPTGFHFASADPQPDIGNNIWNVQALPKGKDGTIEVHGNFSEANPGESKALMAALSVLGANGEYFDQASASFNTAISSLPLLVTQQLNNSRNDVVNPGDTLTYTIKYQNNASTAAHGVNIVASLDSKAINTSTIRAEGAQINNSTITWNASSVSQLEILGPSEGGTVSFSVQLNNPAAKDSSKNLTVISSIKIKATEYDTFFPGSDLTLKISSPSDLSGKLEFVSGALPPQVGKDTVYKVTLQLKNSTNDLNAAVVSAFIPLGAGGFDKSSVSSAEADNVNYDPSTGKLIWNVGILAAHAGQFSPPRTLQFRVRFNPSASQSGSSPVLIKSIVMDATDSFTNQPVHNETEDITTSSLSGQNGYSNGTVQ